MKTEINPSAPLEARKCVPHEEMVNLTEEETKNYLSQVSSWDISGGKEIKKQFKFEDFVKAMEFVNKVAKIAEEEGHHPEVAIYYNRVEITLWTHFLNGLSENDFIIAAKIDNI